MLISMEYGMKTPPPPTKYRVLLEEETGVMDIITLEGMPQERINQWRRYLFARAGVDDLTQCNRVAEAMGFHELVSWEK